jgi:hypothetical protein
MTPFKYRAPKIPALTLHVMAGPDPAIGYPHQFANDAIPVSNQPMEMAVSSPVLTWFERCARYVNSKGGWYNVHIRHPTSPPVAGLLRVGHTGHHKLEALHAADRLGFGRLDFDAAYAVGPTGFLRTQKAAGREIVIDLRVAETSMTGRYGSAVRKLSNRPPSGGMSVIQGRQP